MATLVDVVSNPFSQILGTLAGSGLVATMLIQKAKKSWTSVSAETDVTKLLHNEIERLAAQNKTLSRLLYDMQKQIIQLRTENQDLELQVRKLKGEVNELRGTDK